MKVIFNMVFRMLPQQAVISAWWSCLCLACYPEDTEVHCNRLLLLCKVISTHEHVLRNKYASADDIMQFNCARRHCAIF